MFEQVVLAGGGGRCVWQAGLWQALSQDIALAPRVVATVSASAMTACLLFTQTMNEALAHFRAAFAGNPKNAYWENLFGGREPVFPHYRIYRSSLEQLLAGRIERLRTAPEIRIGVTHFPQGLGVPAALLLGIACYGYDAFVCRELHPTTAQRLGFRPQFHRAQDCRTEAELTELILQSSCTPPFTPLLRVQDRCVLDGGLVDNVPVAALDAGEGEVLVLLTSHDAARPQQFETLSGAQRRLYVQPSAPIPLRVWDYTQPQLIDRTYALGQRDGERLARWLRQERGSAA